MTWAIAGAVVAIALVLLRLTTASSATGTSSRRKTPQQRSVKSSTAASSAMDTPYSAVSIKPGPRSCQAARQQENVRYLKRFAPELPLPTCGESSCSCVFTQHKDRRRELESERRMGFGLQSELYGASGEKERRRRRGRRSGDQS